MDGMPSLSPNQQLIKTVKD